MDAGFLLQAPLNIIGFVVADANRQPGVNVIGHILHALDDNTLPFPLCNLHELRLELLLKDVIAEPLVTQSEPCDRLLLCCTGHIGDLTAAGARR